MRSSHMMWRRRTWRPRGLVPGVGSAFGTATKAKATPAARLAMTRGLRMLVNIQPTAGTRSHERPHDLRSGGVPSVFLSVVVTQQHESFGGRPADNAVDQDHVGTELTHRHPVGDDVARSILLRPPYLHEVAGLVVSH